MLGEGWLAGWLERDAGDDGSGSSVDGLAGSPSSGKLDAAEDTHQLGGVDHPGRAGV